MPEPGRPYRVVDLHEFGDAIESGEHSVEDASPPGQEEGPAVLACSLVVG